jgi:hypothetical protein
MGTERLTIYNTNLYERKWTPGVFTICSIDPGEVNFAIRIEHRKYIPKEAPYSGWKLIQILVLLYDFFDIIGDVNVSCYQLLTNYLDSKIDLLKRCNVFIIEKQLPINYPKVRINQHIVSYIMLRLAESPLNPIIYDIHPVLKSEVFGLTRMKESDLKKKSTSIAKDILALRGDTKSIEKIETNRNIRGILKHDDLGDVVFQMEAFFKYTGYSDYSPPGVLLLSNEVLRVLGEK